MVKNQG